MSLFLGIDTSAYTSSVALLDDKDRILADERILLEVEKGKRGLKQSEALFLHIKNLPFLFARIAPLISRGVKAIAVSAWPRRIEGSYMPVFRAGYSQAQVLSAFAGVPLYEVSHQEGHIMAGIINNHELLDKKEFLAAHFSGGTSEILHIKRGKPGFFQINQGISGTDLHAGQLVDRVGVALGLAFPAGKELEQMALGSTGINIPAIPSSVSDKGFSFSGAETRALSLLKQGIYREDIAYAIFRVIANTLEKSLLKEADKRGGRDVLLVGGVMANSLIRQRLRERLEHPAAGFKLYFAEAALSTDNAVGVAMLASYLSREQQDGEIFNS